MKTLTLFLYFCFFNTIFAQEVAFDPAAWGNVRLVQVSFRDNPKNDEVFMITPPQGWIRVKDLTNIFDANFMAKLKPEETLVRYQAMFPYAILAKSLDAWSWKRAPYQYGTPASLQNYALEFLMEQYAAYLNLDRSQISDNELFEKLKAEISDQEFSLNVTWPWCEKASMKKVCIDVKAQTGTSLTLKDTALIFKQFPQTLSLLKKELSDKVNNWYANNRRQEAMTQILTLSQKLQNKKSTPETILANFYKVLWSEIVVSTYADYCAFPNLICNKFVPEEFNLPLSNENLEIIFSMNLNQND